MCGIAGFWNRDGSLAEPTILKAMTDAIAHRGPDGEGQTVNGPVGLGHRRLAIIDLSSAAAQPMESDDARYTITYNGELYNFQDLRAELETAGHTFHSHSDTEVVLHAYMEWGPDCVLRFNGMFAFAIHDAEEGGLFLARDRYGVKPLYWYAGEGVFLFASEVKAMLAHPALDAHMCLPALVEYMTFQNILSDRTLFEGVRILPPGHRMFLDNSNTDPAPERYWDYDALAEVTENHSESDYVDGVAERLRSAVTRQMISDVPVSSYLSGGVDSGAITSIAAGEKPGLRTFTAGFDLSSASGMELGFDEREKAEALSNLFKTEHYEVVLHAGDMEKVLPSLVWNLEDLRVGQCYPNYYVARLASRFGKVVLSGAGGDELFAGYPWRYYRGLRSAHRDEYLGRYYEYWQRLVSDEERVRLFRPDVLAQIKDFRPRDAFNAVFDGWTGGFNTDADQLHASLYFELHTFLHGLLVVEDRLSMAHGLETRVPFLDNDLVDYALRIPADLKLTDLEHLHRLDENSFAKQYKFAQEHDRGKRVLREAMRRILPEDVADRRKQGFSAPDASWFRGESIDYINELLRDPDAAIYDYFEQDFVSTILDEHSGGHANHRLLIWSFLCLEWWCRIFLRGEVPPRQSAMVTP